MAVECVFIKSNIWICFSLHRLHQIQADKKTGTGHFCDKNQTNQRIDVKSEIIAIQSIIQVVLKSYHHILQIMDMRAI